jgi:hypothetical protein
MTKHIKQIIETDWGLVVVMNDNAILDDSNILQIITFILDKCKEFRKDAEAFKLYKVLVDESTITRNISITKVFEVTELIKKECIGLKMAFIAPHLVNHPDSGTIDTLSSNRGISVRYFVDRDTALDWLLK